MRRKSGNMSPQISLSTMWAKGRFGNMMDFAAKAMEFGFTHIEADSSRSPQMLDELIKSSIPILSIHSPCPARLSSKGIPSSSLSLSSLDEIERKEAISLAKETIDLASKVGAKAIVLHMGEVPVDPSGLSPSGQSLELDKKLKQLYRQGLSKSQEYSQTKEQLISQRASRASRYFESAEKSLEELSRYARQRGIMLGLETRFYFHEIPSLDEMTKLLGGTDKDSVGYWHDMGHAEVNQRLGFARHEEWLSRFKNRMIGIHLHDILGITDHYCPGRGDVDWSLIARYLPQGVLKVCEIGEWNDEEYLYRAIPFLAENGIL
jgi:sugar phosphate isomerase/epimerase